MKTLLAATLVLNAQSHDETSLMQGLARRVDGKIGSDVAKQDSTSKLMETATNMLKNGAGVTPDVVEFIEETRNAISSNVLGAITAAHTADQDLISRIVTDMEAAVDVFQGHIDAHRDLQAAQELTNSGHKQCRQQESHKCGQSRECEWTLETLWRAVVTAETRMKEIHSNIHREWCVQPPSFDFIHEHACSWEDRDNCWDWEDQHDMEGPETSQTNDQYPVVDYTSEVRQWKGWSVTEFGHYIAQVEIVNLAWSAYNTKIIECSGLESELEVLRTTCDDAQDDVDSGACTLYDSHTEASRIFGEAWNQLTTEYNAETGECHTAAGAACDIHALMDAALAAGSTYENAAQNMDCACTGIRQLEFDRMREWETLKIVDCLLNTVYTHVINSINSNEPCPTIESHPEQTQGEINQCHVYDVSWTSNLTIDYCNAQPRWNINGPGDVLPLECPTPPVCEDCNVELPCSSEYNWDTTGHFGDFISSYQQSVWGSDSCTECHVSLSLAGWGGCAAPKACQTCSGHLPALVDVDYVAPSAPCMEHQKHLSLGESDLNTFRCQGTWCIPMQGRCNGVDNCGDGSDEIGCETAWSVPAWLNLNEVCREGANVVAGEQDDVQFFCADGSCTAVEGRCNGHNNCADGSDEANCPENTDGVTLESSSGLMTTLETIQTGAYAFHDRLYTFKSLGHFTGMKMVKGSNEDKFTPEKNVQLKLRLPRPMTVYVVTNAGQTLPWLADPQWTEVQGLTTPEYSGLRMTPDKEWAVSIGVDHLDAIDREEAHYGGGKVFSRTFPAGVVALRGNDGGRGYDWSSAVTGDHPSYLTFVAHPSHVPTAAVTPSTGESMYIGCFVDDPARDLGAMQPGGATYTFATCFAQCAGYEFLSLQYGGECFCANTHSTASQYVQVADSQCSLVREPCSSTSHNCGGTWHQAIYQIGSIGAEVSLQYGHPSYNTNNALCVSMSHNTAGNAGCDATSCLNNGNSDATMQTCNAADAGQRFLVDVSTGQLRSTMGPNLCLHVGVSSNHGACEPFTLQACESHDTRQQFAQESHGGSTVWRNIATNLAIDSNSYRNSVDNWIWACPGTNTAKYFNGV